jgi:hypothetical protein
MIKLRGEDIDSGLREWVKSDLKESPQQSYDLGKFFFSVSIGTIGVIIAIEKLNTFTLIDCPMIFSLIFLFLSIIIALLQVLPKQYVIGDDTDLFEEHKKISRKSLVLVIYWFILWLIGTIFGGIAISK